MLGLPYTLLTVAGLLVVIGLLQPLAARLSLSHTVLLAAVGVLIGVAAGFLLRTDLTDAFNEMAELILDFPISSTEVLYIFLPALLFEAALTIDVRRMLEDAAPIFLLAVIAVLVTTAVVGLALWPLAGMSLLVCLLLAAIIATTDPAAVVAIFRDIGAPGRLSRLVEGESLLNDATAIVLFTMLLADADARPRTDPRGSSRHIPVLLSRRRARRLRRRSRAHDGGAVAAQLAPCRDDPDAGAALYRLHSGRASFPCFGRDRRGNRRAGGERPWPPPV